MNIFQFLTKRTINF